MNHVLRSHVLNECVDDEGVKTLRLDVRLQSLQSAEDAEWLCQSLYELADELGVLCEPPEDER